MKHTKGPWEVEGKSPNGTFTIRANKGTKDIAWVNDHFNEKDDGKPNANLIASAPEMLEILKKLRKAWENNRLFCDDNELFREFLDIIPKAEGSE